MVSGGLESDPTYHATEFGAVLVDAPTPAEAVRLALTGSVQVSLPGLGLTTYSYSPLTVGLTQAEHKPFFVVPTPPTPGYPATVTEWSVKLEDLANFPGSSDWDYNDHSWGVVVTDLEIVETGTASVTGTVWDDHYTPDHQRTTGSNPALSDVSVALYTGGGRYLKTTQTNTLGQYTFAQLPAGSYKVMVEGIIGALPVLPDVGSDSTDSDVLAGGWSAPFTLADGGTKVIDAGLKDAPVPAGFENKDYGVVISAQGTGVSSAELRVAKWEKAFESNTGQPALWVPLQSGYDFIDRDVDRFNVFVKDTAKWNAQTATFNVKVKTTNVAGRTEYDDADTQAEVAVVRQDHLPGWYMSDSQLLVSNEVDDVYTQAPAQLPNKPAGTKSGGVGADESTPSATDKNTKAGWGRDYDFPVSDRTHRIALGGTVTATYAPQGLPAETATSQVKVKKFVKLHINIMKDVAGAQGTPTVTNAMVDADLKKMREIYAQVGLDVQLSNNGNPPQYDISNPPAGTGLDTAPAGSLPGTPTSLDEFATWSDKFENKQWILPTLEEKALFGDATLRTPTTPQGKEDVEVYYVNRLSDGSGGESFVRNFLLDGIPTPERYDLWTADSVVVTDQQLFPNGNYAQHLYFVLAHEVGHILDDRPNNSSAGDVSHFPYSGGNPSPTERTNLMVNGAFSLAGGIGFRMNAAGKFEKDVLGKRKYELLGPAILDSRRLTGEQETAMTARDDLMYPGE